LSVKLKTNIYLNFKIYWLIKTIPPGKWWRVAKSICQFKNKRGEENKFTKKKLIRSGRVIYF
jgi:hypothetical protein